MSGEKSSYLGREHFILFGTESRQIYIARRAFYQLVGRVVFPNVRNLHDFQSFGLVIRPREEVGLGDVPEFAQYSRNVSGSPVDMSYKCEEYAVGAESLGRVVDTLETSEDINLRGISTSMLRFCGELLLKYPAETIPQ